MIHKSEPSMLPWATPEVILFQVDSIPHVLQQNMNMNC